MIAASKYGAISNIAFPNVPANATKEQVHEMARDFAGPLMNNFGPADTVVMIQGEMTLTYELVRIFKIAGYVVCAACSERKTQEIHNPDGTTTKTSVFEFVQFRIY